MLTPPHDSIESPVPAGFAPVDWTGPFDAVFGPMYWRIAGGKMQMGFRVAERHTNFTGVCHGGAISTFADWQVHVIRRAGLIGEVYTPTISLSMDFLAPVLKGQWVTADVSLIKLTRLLLFTQAILVVEDAVVGRSAALYRVKEARPPGPRSD